MKSVVVAVIALAAYCLPLSSAMAKDEALKPAAAATKAVRDDAVKISNAAKVIKEIAAIPKKKIPPDLLSGSSAVVIFPKVAKHDLMVKGGKTGGILLVHEADGVWSNPVFLTLSGGTIGWQVVSDHLDIILVIKSKKSVDAILKGKFAMDAKIALVPGRLGPSMKAATPAELKADISSYIRSSGTFWDEVTVAGTTLQIDAAANDAFYAQPKVEVTEIVSGTLLKSSEEITSLQKLLTSYATVK